MMFYWFYSGVEDISNADKGKEKMNTADAVSDNGNKEESVALPDSDSDILELESDSKDDNSSVVSSNSEKHSTSRSHRFTAVS